LPVYAAAMMPRKGYRLFLKNENRFGRSAESRTLCW
jgi:hypothetical protein